jgi:hypothetical protein
MSAPVINGRKLAHVPDKADPRDRLAGAGLLKASPPPPPSASCRDLVRDILDQQRLGSCTANATAQAVRCAMLRVLAAGAAAPPFFSRLFAYYIARAFDHDIANDDGAQIRNVFAGIMEYGFCPEDVWPYSDDSSPGAPFSKMPPWAAFRAADDQKLGGSYEKISSSGAARVDDVKRAIAARHVVVFGAPVSEAYCNDDLGDTPLEAPSPAQVAGLHAQCLAEYSGEVFGVVNSWGSGWGDGGWARWSASYVADDRVSDLWIVNVVPRFSAGASS